MKHKPYPAYKDSEIEWLGDIPAHWAYDRLKWSVDGCWNGVWGDEPNGEADLACIRVADFDRQKKLVSDGDRTFRSIPASQRTNRLLRKGDLLLEKSGGGEQQPVGAVVLFDKDIDAVCSNFVARMPVASGWHAPYLAYLHSVLYDCRINTCSIKQNTGIQNLDSAAYLNERSPFPPHQEQLAIAAFLDRETSKIDTLISKQERLIDLLQEKRQATISHAVTKGLNQEEAPMRDSGVDWLGKVPAHWKVMRIKWVAKMESGHTPDKKVEAYWTDCDIPWVSLNDTKYLKDHDYITNTTYQINSLGIANSSARLLPANAVVFSRDATIGRSAITTREMAVSQHFIAWLCAENMLPEFLLRVLRSMTQELERLTFGATLKTIGMPDVKTLTTTVPPVAEQEVIIKHISASCSKIDTLIEKCRRSIELMKERRSVLISAAVTGKIDVRDEASGEAA